MTLQELVVRNKGFMEYQSIIEATFVERPNRFIAYVLIDGQKEKVHVKNTGRCRELLTPNCRVYLSAASNPLRKTRYDLIAVKKNGNKLFNIDSNAPNVVMKEWLCSDPTATVQPEYTYGKSRLDFCVTDSKGDKTLIEVKGCTLEIDGKGYFPDAPTQRGTKHLKELALATQEGYHCVIAFVIQTDGICRVFPNETTDPEFTQALRNAHLAGVEIWFMECMVTPESLQIIRRHQLPSMQDPTLL